jgi:RHS repeat-associated protein
VRYLLNDNLGTPSLVVDDTGRILAKYARDPWGNLETSWESIPLKWQFTGKENDPEVGGNVFYFNARFYDAERGAFIGRDPKLQFWTPYSYVGNGPLVGVDFDGKAAKYWGLISSAETDYVLERHGVRGLFAAKSITSDASSFGKTIQTEMKLLTDEGNPADAMRHAFLSASLARRFGPEEALMITNLHEIPAIQDKGRVMDSYNNFVAIMAAANNPELGPAEIASELRRRGWLATSETEDVKPLTVKIMSNAVNLPVYGDNFNFARNPSNNQMGAEHGQPESFPSPFE